MTSLIRELEYIAFLDPVIERAIVALELFQETADGQIVDYISAVERGDIDDYGSWVYRPETYAANRDNAIEAYKALGLDPDVEVSAIRNGHTEENDES